jgi:hypothetical protein
LPTKFNCKSIVTFYTSLKKNNIKHEKHFSHHLNPLQFSSAQTSTITGKLVMKKGASYLFKVTIYLKKKLLQQVHSSNGEGFYTIKILKETRIGFRAVGYKQIIKQANSPKTSRLSL